MSSGKIPTIKTEITGRNGFPIKGPLGRSTTLTGMFSSAGRIVTGTGTLFETEITGSGWLYSTTLNEVRKFTQINGNTNLYLETAFTSDQTNESVIVVQPLYISIAAKNIHATNDAQINNRKFAAGEVKNYNFDDGMNPITYHAASGAPGLSGEIMFDLAY
jgi:hypothetical protein